MKKIVNFHKSKLNFNPKDDKVDSVRETEQESLQMNSSPQSSSPTSVESLTNDLALLKSSENPLLLTQNGPAKDIYKRCYLAC